MHMQHTRVCGAFLSVFSTRRFSAGHVNVIISLFAYLHGALMIDPGTIHPSWDPPIVASDRQTDGRTVPVIQLSDNLLEKTTVNDPSLFLLLCLCRGLQSLFLAL